MISFWTGLLLYILTGVLLTATGVWITKRKGGGSTGGILGFFLGVGFVFAMVFLAGRLYVVTGDAEWADYLVYGSQTYTLKDSEEVDVKVTFGQCMVINDWDKPVVVEFMVYGGYGFGGDTKWVHPREGELFEEPRIFYFYDDEPPDEISIRGDSNEEHIRLWLRNKRE